MKSAFHDIEYHNCHNVLNTFKNHLNNCASNWHGAYYSEFYAPYIVFFQSSGTGKSKLLQQLSNNHYVLYLCLHVSPSSGIPQATKYACKFLLQKSENIMVRTVAFLCACIELLDNKSIQEWNDMQKTDKFGEVVEEKAGEYAEKLNKLSKDLKFQDLERLCISEIKRIWLEKSEHVSVFVKSKAKLVFIFDEARSLLKNDLDSLDQKDYRFLNFRRALRCLPENIFTIIADTLSTLSNFQPVSSLDPSSRVQRHAYKLFSPFYLIPTFDLFKKENSQLWTLKDLFSTGRPLWGAALSKGIEIPDLICLAQQKLIGGITKDQWIENKPNIASAIAILSSRISINVVLGSQIASELVAGYMAICFYISDDFQRLMIMYPSEPILAEASAQLMADLRVLEIILFNLKTALQYGYIEPGYRGELIARLILTIAWNKTISSVQPNNLLQKSTLSLPITLYSQRVRLCAYLKSLFGEDNYKKVFSELPSELANGWIGFTHFIAINYIPNDTKLLEIFNRFGAILFSKRNQNGVDFIIPILLNYENNEHEDNEDRKISYILCQIKNWKRNYDDNWPASATSKLSTDYIFKDISTNDNPYLSLYMQLGASKSEITHIEPKTHYIRNKKIKTRSQYCVAALGLKTDVYDCLNDLSEILFSCLKDIGDGWPDPKLFIKDEILLKSMIPHMYE